MFSQLLVKKKGCFNCNTLTNFTLEFSKFIIFFSFLSNVRPLWSGANFQYSKNIELPNTCRPYMHMYGKFGTLEYQLFFFFPFSLGGGLPLLTTTRIYHISRSLSSSSSFLYFYFTDFFFPF